MLKDNLLDAEFTYNYEKYLFYRYEKEKLLALQIQMTLMPLAHFEKMVNKEIADQNGEEE